MAKLMRGTWLRTLVAAALPNLVTGCGPQLRAIPTAGQTVLSDGRARLSIADLQVTAGPVGVPIAENHELIGLTVSIANNRWHSVTLRPDDVRLIDRRGLARPAVPPAELRQAARAFLSQRLRWRARTWRLGLGICYGGRPEWACYDPWWPYLDWPNRRGRVVAFLGRLWSGQIVQPGRCGSGHVVFRYDRHLRGPLRLRLTIRPAVRSASAPASLPAAVTCELALELR